MAGELNFDYSYAKAFFGADDLEKVKKVSEEAKKTLLSRSGAGNDFLGWIDLPVEYDREEFERVIKASEKIKGSCDVFIVIGIGGSYLGARAAIEFLRHSFYNVVSKDKRKTPEIYFAGCNMSELYFKDLMDVIGDKDVCVNVISKSGTTIEPAVAFRFIKQFMEDKYGKEEAAKRIYATTDKTRGALKQLADNEGYETFVVPDDIGGRFSVLSSVGLLPIAVSGADIRALMNGAAIMREKCINEPFETNPSMQYAVIRNIMYGDGKSIEVIVNYEPSLHYISEWWKQLYAESEGKDHKGLFPAAMDFSTDLHSQGQFLQDGPRIMFETIMKLEGQEYDVIIGEDKDDLDGLNYLTGKHLDHVNRNALIGSRIAHVDGGVPALTIDIPDRSEESLGKLFYFFEFACGVSGYMIDVNPFNQPGVEDYKKNMFALLGRPGYEEQLKKLEERMK